MIYGTMKDTGGTLINACQASGDKLPDGFTLATQAEFNAARTFLSTIVQSPQQAANDLLQSKLQTGIALTCTATAAVSGTYALDDISTRQIYQIGLFASQFNTFPSGGVTQPYPDATGNPHTFTIAQFVAFLQVVAPLVSNLTTQAQIMAQGGPPTWPAQTGTIP